MDLKLFKKVYFIGLGGIGVSAIARLFKSYGAEVSGSDKQFSDITKKLESEGIKVFYEHSADNISAETELIVYSPAVPENNPEREYARQQNIKQLSYPEVLGELSRHYHTIAIAGTNGKSTTTAIIGKIFVEAGLDPTVIVGTQVEGFNSNLRIGKSNILIVEACEWKAHFLHLQPQEIVLTNLMEDHLDFYKDLNDLKEKFNSFIALLPDNGQLYFNADDKNLASLELEPIKNKFSWSMLETVDLKTVEQKQTFKLYGENFELHIPGVHNVYNSLSAITVAKEHQISTQDIKKALVEFKGSWRRFETVGNMQNKQDVLVISDYAHHPEAIKFTLQAAKDFYPDKKIFAIFQPHHYDRTFKLFKDFVHSFKLADKILITEIYDVPGRENDGERQISGQKLAEAIKKIQPDNEVLFAQNQDIAKEIISANVADNDLLLFMGAGDIDNLARRLI